MTTSAPGTAKEQVERLLRLVPYLYARGTVRVDEAAADLDVSPGLLVNDLKVLFMCGLPGGYPDDLINVDLDALEGEEADGVVRVSNADYLARPLQLSPTEATAVIVALRALRAGAADETREIIDRTLAKLEAAVSADPRVDPGPVTPEPDGGFRDTVEQAVREQRQLQLTYYVPARDQESDRVVDPRGVVTAHGHAYLDAWCHSAEAPRLFRLDRIHDAALLDEPVSTPAEPPRDLGEGLFQRSQDTTLVTVLLQPPARWVVEYYPVEAIRPQRSGELQVDLLVADTRWLQRFLLRLAPHASVVAPQEFTDSFRAQARAALSLYHSTAYHEDVSHQPGGHQ
ncbi:MAG: helix-turn-helix transcriptional regulator [Nocardioides sp.]